MLGKRDLREAIACVQAIIEAPNHDTFVATLVRRMHPMMRAHVTGYNEADPIRKRFAFVVHPSEIVSDAILQAWVRHAHQNPLIQHVQRNPGDSTVHKITDFVSQDKFRRTALCRQTYQKMGAEYQIAMPFPLDGSAAVAIVFNRPYDFDERDRELLVLLQPLVIAAYRSVQRLTDLQLAQEEAHPAGDLPDISSRPLPDDLGLTRREAQVLGHLNRGKSNRQIATALKLSTRTIEKYVEHLLHKLKVPTRAVACAKFQRLHRHANKDPISKRSRST